MLEAGALFGEAGLVALHRAAPAGTSAADVRRLLAEQPGLLPPYPETVDAVSDAMSLPRPAPPPPPPPRPRALGGADRACRFCPLDGESDLCVLDGESDLCVLAGHIL